METQTLTQTINIIIGGDGLASTGISLLPLLATALALIASSIFSWRYLSRRSISGLYDQNTFDGQFLKDIARARSSLVIESPFIRLGRVEQLLSVIAKLRRRGVTVIINTRSPKEHDNVYETQAEEAIEMLQNLGVTVLFTVKHHRKLAVIDGEVFYEGSLNILSYYDSCEIMRRTVSPSEAEVLLRFIGLQKYLTKAS